MEFAPHPILTRPLVEVLEPVLARLSTLLACESRPLLAIRDLVDVAVSDRDSDDEEEALEEADELDSRGLSACSGQGGWHWPRAVW